MSSLEGYRRVLLVLQDGRAIVGKMAGYDHVVLSESKERMEEGVQEIPLGLYLVKGDTILSFPAVLQNPRLASRLAQIQAVTNDQLHFTDVTTESSRGSYFT